MYMFINSDENEIHLKTKKEQSSVLGNKITCICL